MPDNDTPDPAVAALDQLAAVRAGLDDARKALSLIRDVRDYVAQADDQLAALESAVKPVRSQIPDGVYGPLHEAWDAVKVLRAALAEPAVAALLDYGRGA